MSLRLMCNLLLLCMAAKSCNRKKYISKDTCGIVDSQTGDWNLSRGLKLYDKKGYLPNQKYPRYLCHTVHGPCLTDPSEEGISTPEPGHLDALTLACESSTEVKRVMATSNKDAYHPNSGFIERSTEPTGSPLPHLRVFPRASRPTADREFTRDRIRIQALSDRLLRVEYAADRVFEDRASFTFPLRGATGGDVIGDVSTTFDDATFVLTVATPLVRVEVPTQSEKFEDGMIVAIALTSDKAVHRYVSTEAPTSGVGLLDGTCRTLDGVDGFMHREGRTYASRDHVQLKGSVLSRGGVVFIDDSRRPLFTDDGWFAPRKYPDGSLLYRDVYVLVSNSAKRDRETAAPHDYCAALRAFSRAAGGTPMLPRQFLGNWWSRWHKYTEKSLSDLVLDFERRAIPLGVVIIDMDWHLVEDAKKISGPQCDGWTGYSWNNEFFPEPARFVKWLHSRGMSTALNLHPAGGVWKHEKMYMEYAEFLGAVEMANRGSPIPFDLSDDLSAAAYFKILLHPHEEMGDYEKSFWWIDWQQGPKSRLKGVDPLFQLNHLHYLDLGRNKGKRPAVFSRFAGLGSHRYPIGFSGDTWATWETLAFQTFMTASAANVNFFYWSHDIGGFTRQIPNNGELYARWVQWGCLSPILRLHSSNNPYIFRNPWAYSAEVCKAATDAMRLRHEMVPYIFSCVYQAHVDNTPLVMPMYYTHSEEEAAFAVPAQYWFGSELIVAPIELPKDQTTNLARQVVWFPGTNATDGTPMTSPWRHLHTGEALEAGMFHVVYGTSLDYVPIFAKPGAIVPRAPPPTGSGQELNSLDSPTTVHLTVIAGANGSFELYEDEEVGKQRKFITDISMDWSSAECRLNIAGIAQVSENRTKVRVTNDEDLAGAIPKKRSWNVTVLGVSPSAGVSYVSGIDREELTVAYNAEQESIQFSIADVPTPQDIIIDIVSRERTGLLSARDRRAEKMEKLLETFAVGTEVVWRLSRRIKELMEDISRLASVHDSKVVIKDRMGTSWTVSPEMKRALFETVVGSGCGRSYLSRPGAPVVAWKREGDTSTKVAVDGKDVGFGKGGYAVFWPVDANTISSVSVAHGDVVRIELPLRDLVDNKPWPAAHVGHGET